MIEAYKIGIALSLTGDANKKLGLFTKTIGKANKAVESLIKSTGILNKEFESLTSILLKLNPELAKLNLDFKEMGLVMRPVNSGLTGFNKRISASILPTQALNRNIVDLKANMAGLGLASNTVQGVGGGRRGGSGKRSGGGIGLRAHARGLGIAGIGFGLSGPVGLGTAALGYGLYGSFKAQGEYQKAFATFQSKGFSPAQNAQANQFATSTNIAGVTPTDLIYALRDAAMATQNFAMGMKFAPMLAQATMANNALFKGFTEQQRISLIQFAEMRGGSDPAKIAQSLNLGEQLFTATGGSMLPSQLRNFQKYAQTAAYMMDVVGYLQMEPSIQEMGGSKVGTGLQTLYNQLITGKGMSTAEARELTRLGFMKPGSISYDPLHRRLINKPGALQDKYAQDLQTRPAQFIMNDVLPALKRAGFTTESSQIQEIGYIFGRTAAALASNILKNQQKIDRSQVLNAKASDIPTVYGLAQKAQAGKVQDLAAAFNRFETAIGYLTNPLALSGLNYLTILFTKLADVATYLGSAPVQKRINERAPLAVGIAKHIAEATPIGAIYHTIKLGEEVIARTVTNMQSRQASKQPIASSQYNPNSPHANPPVMWSGTQN